MEFWMTWLDLLESLLQSLASSVGLGQGFAIVALTLLLRFALLPVSWSCAYRACIHQKKVRGLQPELARLKERFRSDPRALAEQTLEAYRRKGIGMIETRPLLGAIVQMPVFLGMFQMLRQGLQQSRFLWIANLSRPDVWLALIAAATTALMALANPDLPEQTRMLMIVIPSILAFVFALKFASALALYWAASNCFTAAQTSAVHYLVGRRIRAGAVRI
jgi:YidC/Oxa1 family membrane protein insertase